MKHAALCAALVSVSLASAAAAAPLTKDQQKCVGALNQGLAKVTSTQANWIESCIKRVSKGTAFGADSCSAGDAKSKVKKAKAKTVKDVGKKCLQPLPPYGVTNAATVNAVGREGALDLAHDVFGPRFDSVILTEAFNKAVAKCQQALAGATKKCLAAKLAEFLKCKKTGLKTGAIDSPAGLAACVGADPKGAVAKICDEPVKGDGIRKALTKQCVAKSVDLAVAVPPCGVAADVTVTHACLERVIECRVCRALALGDGLTRDCDTLDDGLANDSCAPANLLANRTFLPLLVVATPFGATQPATDAFTTDFRVQNLGTAVATVLVTYFNQDGSTAASGLVTLPVGGKQSLVAGFNENSNLGQPFVGSAVLSSDQEIVAIGQPSGFFANFTAFASGAYDGFDESAAGTTLLFPSVTCNFFGSTTTFYVQNTSPTAAVSCTVTYTAEAAGQSAMEVRAIAPNGVAIFDQSSDLTPGLGCETLGVGSGMFSGSARVTCAGANVVGSLVELNTATGALSASNGFSQGSTAVSLPLIQAANAGFFTGVQVRNVGASSTDVTISYGTNTVGGGNNPAAETATIAAGASAIFTQQGVSGPNDWGAIGNYLGGATITQTGSSELVALVHQQQASGSIGSDYGGFDVATATDRLTFPLLIANLGATFSTISIQALAANTSVTITYSTNAGNPPTKTPNADPLTFTNAGDARTIVLDGVNGANNWDTFGPYVGSALVTTSDPSKKIVGVVTTKALPGFGDSAATYEGFKLD